MRLVSLAVTDHRNLKQVEFAPGPELTVLCGPNGQGKTNLLEAVWLLTGGKSFRGSKDAELIRRGAEFSVLDGVSEAQDGRQDHIRLTVGGKDTPRPGRTARLNGAEVGRAAALAGRFTAVVFEPDDLSLVKSGPAGRRRFLDAALCQLWPGYVATLRRYSRLLAQKNSLLKYWDRTPGAGEMCDAFDADLAVQGGEICRRRGDYLARLAPLAAQNYAELSRGGEALSLAYRADQGPEHMLDALRAARAADRRAGFCTVGPHREDFTFALDGQPARVFASQGQQRSAVLSLKLAEASVAQSVTGEHPVMLLDDVLSELDPQRQEYLLTRMREKQTIVTACDSSLFHKTEGAMFRVEQGEVKEM
ncbi:DNA replication and repair protein RecF [Oscillospiraceae bacterium]|uniref:DNA replication/repair protein RecF n=1 Tax=Allofournierella sp. TaxID=1940256 RepID=UPI0015AB22A4|nr:DNA replication and repair protein RecF [Oscillospiraceae bacterium]